MIKHLMCDALKYACSTIGINSGNEEAMPGSICEGHCARCLQKACNNNTKE